MITQKQHIAWIMMICGISMAALSRFLPHPMNFTPIAAMALFGGASFKNRWLALALPLGGMLLSDILFEAFKPGYGFHATLPFVYGSLIIISFIGMAIKNNRGPVQILGASILSTAVFFIVTNFGTWLLQNLYPHTLTGLTACYVAGIPFVKNSFGGDLFFSLVLFGGYFALAKSFKYKLAN